MSDVNYKGKLQGAENISETRVSHPWQENKKRKQEKIDITCNLPDKRYNYTYHRQLWPVWSSNTFTLQVEEKKE